MSQHADMPEGIDTVAVIGAGTIGASWTALFLAAGALGGLYYVWRRRDLKRKGYRIEDLLVRDLSPLLEDAD